MKVFLDSVQNKIIHRQLQKRGKQIGFKISSKDGVVLVNENRHILARGQIKYFEGNYAMLEFSDISDLDFIWHAKGPGKHALLKYHNFSSRDRCIHLSSLFKNLKKSSTSSDLFSTICRTVINGIDSIDISAPRDRQPIQISPYLSTLPLTSFSTLNQGQKDAIKKAYTCDWFNIIHGPPGTGKSECLTVLLEVMAKEGKRVLICAESNKPVDNLLAKFAETRELKRMNEAWTILRLGDKLRIEKDWKKLLLNFMLDVAARCQEWTEKRNRNNRYRAKNKGYAHRDIPAKLPELGDISHKSRKEIKDAIFNKTKFVFSTQCSIFDKKTFEALSNRQFDYAIIDEASQSFSGQTLMAIAVSKRVIFAGDHKQLPPCIIDRGQPHLAESLFEMLMTRLDEKPHVMASYYTMLNVQYRMNHKLMTVSNSRYYENKVQSGIGNREIILTNLQSTWAGTTNILPKDIPLVWLDHECQEDGRNPRSITNPGEVKIVISLLDEVTNRLHIPPNEVGVIVSLKAQQLLIIDKLGKHHSLKKHVGRDGQLAIATVDSFQGLEKEVIIYASVRSNDKGNIGFLSDERRFNVACTRAKRLLVFVGNSQCLLKAQPDGCFRDLFDHTIREGRVLVFHDKFKADKEITRISSLDSTGFKKPCSQKRRL